MGKMYYTEEEAGEKLGLGPGELAEHVAQKKLRLFKDGVRNMYMASEIDALAPPVIAEAEEEVELSPVEDTASLDAADTGPIPTKEDTVITAEGISIFDDEELEIAAADPMAKTQIAPSVQDQIGIDGVGSGSGLLDLTRESDDTSLGAVIDHIDLEEPAGEQAPQVAAYGEAAGAADAGAAVVPEIREEIDATAGLFSGLLVGSAIVALLLGAVTLAAGAGVVPGYVATMKENMTAVAGGTAVLVVAFGVIGLLVGKSIAAKQQAIEQMGA